MSNSQHNEMMGRLVQSGDRIAYYTYLKDVVGDPYGGLALSVVTNGTFAGAVANSFMVNAAAQANVSLTANDLATFSLKLMEADFAARSSGWPVTWEVIRDYHVNALAEIGLPPTAWTAYEPLANAGVKAGQLWQSFTSPEFYNDIGSQLGVYFSNLDWWDSWSARLDFAVADALTVNLGSNAFGDYSVFWKEGYVIGGTQHGDDIVGLSTPDVIMLFDGTDQIAIGGEGNDTIYGGFYNDILIGHMGSDILIGGEGNDTISGDEIDWALFSSGGRFIVPDNAGDILKGGKGKDVYVIAGGVILEEEGGPPINTVDQSPVVKHVTNVRWDEEPYYETNSYMRGVVNGRHATADIIDDEDGKGEIYTYHVSQFLTDPNAQANYNKHNPIIGTSSRTYDKKYVAPDGSIIYEYIPNEIREMYAGQEIPRGFQEDREAMLFTATNEHGNAVKYLGFFTNLPNEGGEFGWDFLIADFKQGDFGITLA